MSGITKYIIISFIIVGCISGAIAQLTIQQLQGMVIKDESLIVPGVGAGGLVLDMPTNDVVVIKGAPLTTTKKGTSDFMNDVLKVHSEVSLPFNYLYVYNNSNIIIGFENNLVSFIVVWQANGVLIEGIPLSKGIAVIVFHYGNQGLSVIDQDKATLFIYPYRGIAFIDDNKDESIDAIMIFKKKGSE